MKYRDNDRQKMFTRRVALLAGAKLTLFSTLAARMYYLQVLEADKYQVLADENRISMRLLPPPRGQIVDRHGELLAINQENYRVMVIQEQARNMETVLHALSNIIPLSENEITRIIRETKRKRSYVPVTVRENLSWDDVAKIEVNAPDLPGVMIDVGQSRFYPHTDKVAHVLGYVAGISENDDVDDDPLLELPGFKIGRAGMEKVHDLSLRGKGGTSRVEVNAVGRVIREMSREDGRPGDELSLTLDLSLQEFAINRMGQESGGIVLMDVTNGDVLVMASNPGYNPNAFTQGINANYWKELVTNQKSPLSNKCIAGQYAPGSTFKIVVALAALESGLVTPDFRAHCSGYVELGDARFHCWQKQGHGGVDILRAMAVSCDVYFYEIAKRIGIDRIAEMSKRLGLGGELKLDLPGERKGLIPTREWKRKVLKTSWSQGETLVAGIGQGYVLTTPLQLAVMTARVANGGFAVRPRLTRALNGELVKLNPNDPFPNINLNKQALNLVRKGLKMVVNEPGGTAYRVRIEEPNWTLAGKTGTSQVRRITQKEREVGVRKNDELPWKERDHALFVGYAPEENPRYAIAVVIEHGGGGGSVAAPIGSDIIKEALKRDTMGPRPRLIGV